MQIQSHVRNEGRNRTCSRSITNGCSKTEPIPCRCAICEEEAEIRYAERMYTESTWRMYYRIIAARKLSSTSNQELLTTIPRQPLVVIEDNEKNELKQRTTRPKTLEDSSSRKQKTVHKAGERKSQLDSWNDLNLRYSNEEKLEDSYCEGRYVSDEGSVSSEESSNDDEYNIFTLDLDY